MKSDLKVEVREHSRVLVGIFTSQYKEIQKRPDNISELSGTGQKVTNTSFASFLLT